MKKLLLLLTFILFLTQVSAQELNLDYNIEYNKVLVNYKFYNTKAFNLNLPPDHSAVSYYIDKQPIIPEIIDNKLYIPSAAEIELNFLTKYPLEKSGQNTFFLTDINLPIDIQSKITLTLPENVILSKPVDQGSVFPQAKTSTDGQQITLEWNTNLQKDKSFSILVIFKQNKTYWWLLIPLLAITIILAYFLKKKPKIKRIIKKQPVKLKPEEKKIINILNKKNGECEQATLRLVTDYPKATLSRILKELEQRNIIKKISKGKKNIIVIK